MKPYEFLAHTGRRAQSAVHAESTDWFNFRAEADTREAKVYIYDVIGGWFGVEASDFVRELAGLDVDSIELHLNSPGGSVFDGMAIYNALRQHKAKVTTVVDGLAASMASVIALAGDEITMAEGSFMMIHDASGGCLGNASDMAEMAGILDKLSGSMADLYARKGGGTSEDWRTVMRAETWYTAAEAVAAGLADSVDTDQQADAEAVARFDLSIFAHAGRENAPAPIVPGSFRAQHKPTHDVRPEPANSIPNQEEGPDMSDSLISGLRERLGVRADADLDENGLLAALDEALNEQSTEPVTPSEPEGTVRVDSGALAQLQADAAAGREARNQQIAAHRESAISAAVSDGRIPPARADHWRAQLTADPGAEQVLAALPKGLVPLEPQGFAGGVEESNDDDRFYASLFGEQKGA